MAELRQCLGLDLTNAFARDAKSLPNLFERQRLDVAEPKAHRDDLAFALAQPRKNLMNFIGEQVSGRNL